MTRRAFTLATTISLTLFLITLLVLAFSYVRPIRPWNSTRPTAWRIDKGIVSVGRISKWTINTPTYVPGRPNSRVYSGVVTTYQPRLTIPLWPLLFATAILPAASLIRKFRELPSGACQTCGYNLTGNTSGICPECGTNVASERHPS